MNKKVLNLHVTCKLEYTLQPADDCHVTYPDLDLQTFLSDFHNNLEVIDLLEEGESVGTDNYELTPLEDDLIGISRSGSDPQAPFYVSCNTLKSISETLSHYDLKERFLEVGIEFENFSDTSSEKFGCQSYETLVPECNIIDERQALADDSITVGQTNDAVSKTDATVDDPTLSEVGHPPSYGGDLLKESSRLYNSNTAAASQTSVVIEHEVTSVTANSVVHQPGDILSTPSTNVGFETNQADSQSVPVTGTNDSQPGASTNKVLREENLAVSVLQDGHVVISDEGFLDSPRLPDDDLPPKELNIMATLKVHLKKKGSDSVSSLKFNPETHETLRNPVFSNNVSFKIGSVLHTYESCTRFARKLDAKKNAAYQACKALGLGGLSLKPNQLTCSDDSELPPKSLNVIGRLNQRLQKIGTLDSLEWHVEPSVVTLSGPLFTATVSFSIEGSTYRFQTSKEFLNKTDAKRSVAYKAYKSLGLC